MCPLKKTETPKIGKRHTKKKTKLCLADKEFVPVHARYFNVMWFK